MTGFCSRDSSQIVPENVCLVSDRREETEGGGLASLIHERLECSPLCLRGRLEACLRLQEVVQDYAWKRQSYFYSRLDSMLASVQALAPLSSERGDDESKKARVLTVNNDGREEGQHEGDEDRDAEVELQVEERQDAAGIRDYKAVSLLALGNFTVVSESLSR